MKETNSKNESLENTLNNAADCSDCGLKAQGITRRKFARNAAVVSPILASLASAPVLGAPACSPSGVMSGNLSGHDHEECTGNGCTPGFWMTHPGLWELLTPLSAGHCQPDPGDIQCNGQSTWIVGGSTWDSTFDCAMPCTEFSGDIYLLQAMLDHSKANPGDPNLGAPCGTFVFHAIAALLNAYANPYVFGAEPDEIHDLVCAAVNNGDLEFFSDVKETLVNMNEAGSCYLNAHGVYECPTGFVFDEEAGTCIPACPEGHTFDFDAGECVPENSQTSLESETTTSSNNDGPNEFTEGPYDPLTGQCKPGFVYNAAKNKCEKIK